MLFCKSFIKSVINNIIIYSIVLYNDTLLITKILIVFNMKVRTCIFSHRIIVVLIVLYEVLLAT
jgi:hypothetical protein